MDVAPFGCSKRLTALGATYLRIHYSADPAKNDVWAAVERAKSPVREWLREMEMDENVFDGEAVFPEYRDDWHCMLQDSEIPLIPHSIYVGGWDCGQTLSPAFVLYQITPRPFQVHAILEVLPPAPEPMEKFAPKVLHGIMKRLPGSWDEVKHYGDATVTTRNGSTGETAQQAARRVANISIKPQPNTWMPRYGAMTWALSDSIDEKTPRFLIDGLHCPVLREGFRGAYRFEETPKSEAGAGRILAMPLKNGYSHVQDAAQYAMLKIQSEFKGVERSRKLV